jgi:hypothetical protein
MRRGGGSDRASHTAALLTAAVSLAIIRIAREIFWGLRDDRRHHRRDDADAVVLAGAQLRGPESRSERPET